MTFGWPILEVETQKRRLTVLAYLSRAQGYEAAALILVHHCLRKGVPTTSDQMELCLAWLNEAELVSLRDADGDVIARVSVRGREVAQGIAVVPGVLRPEP